MLKKFLAIFLSLFLASPAFAATWYAGANCTSGNMSSCAWYSTQGANCTNGSGLMGGLSNVANGDTYSSNGCTAVTIDADPGSVSKQVTITNDGTNSGYMTLALSSGLTIHANILAVKDNASHGCVDVTGSSGSATISGNVTGGTSTSAYGIYSVPMIGGTLTITGTTTGGSASSASGIYNGAAAGGTYNLGSVYAGSAAAGAALNSGTPTAITATGTLSSQNATTNNISALAAGSVAVTVNGNVIGNDSYTGCYGLSNTTGISTVKGGFIANGKKSLAINYAYYFSGSSTSYTMLPANSSYAVTNTPDQNGSNAIVLPMDPGAANVKSGTVYGPYTGTLSAGGGTVGWGN